MPRFLIEVPHQPQVQACARAVHVFLATGSHLMTQADWGCMDGIHSAWIIVDAENKDEARSMVPPAFRADARVIGLNKFTLEQVENLMSHHDNYVGVDAQKIDELNRICPAPPVHTCRA